MWKIFLGFLLNRVVLLGVAFAVIHFAATSQEKSSTLPPFSEKPGVSNKIIERVNELPETQAVALWVGKSAPFPTLFTEGKSPYIWLGTLVSRTTGVSPAFVLILLSNIFFLLFLWEIFRIVSRISSEDAAEYTGLFLVFWPASYELSLGSAISFEALFLALAMRLAIDDKWLLCGLALGVLGLTDPVMVGVLPLIACWFWFYSRHYMMLPLIKRVSLLLVPIVVVVILRWPLYANFVDILRMSALNSLIAGGQTVGLKWTLTHSFAGQTIAILFMGIGAGIAAASNISTLHRAIPIYFFVLWLLFSPYGGLASRAAMAGVCFQGIANASSRGLARLILGVFLVASAYELYLVLGPGY